MSDHNDLTPQQQGELIHTIQEQGIGNVLKPLTKEIHLFDTHVAGTSYIADRSVFDRISVGDPLTLQREQNRYDDNAILVLTKDRQKLGYIPEKDNLVFARLMDAGKLLTAHIADIHKSEKYVRIEIGIYLIDF
ncbi:MAG: HIRAN domain-containing protein [Lachnospiraceae bacterium]|jgi:hypothetical protein